MRGHFAPPVPASTLPGSLLQRFAGEGPAPLVALLRFVAPTTTTSDGAALIEGAAPGPKVGLSGSPGTDPPVGASSKGIALGSWLLTARSARFGGGWLPKHLRRK